MNVARSPTTRSFTSTSTTRLPVFPWKISTTTFLRLQGNEEIIKLRACPICGSNLGTFLGDGEWVNTGHDSRQGTGLNGALSGVLF
jgi:hypothetical protein